MKNRRLTLQEKLGINLAINEVAQGFLDQRVNRYGFVSMTLQKLQVKPTEQLWMRKHINRLVKNKFVMIDDNLLMPRKPESDLTHLSVWQTNIDYQNHLTTVIDLDKTTALAVIQDLLQDLTHTGISKLVLKTSEDRFLILNIKDN